MTTTRPATAADMSAVADLWHEGWHDGHAGHVPDGLTAARTLEAFHERTPARVADTTVAISHSGELVGFVMVVGDEVEQVFVGPAARGSGLAAVLLSEAERQVAAGGHTEAWLAVVAGNARARHFYEKCGWVDGGELPYEVTAGGETFVSPCRRYVKAVSRGRAAGADMSEFKRKLTVGMNLSLDGYVAAPGDDLSWGVPSDELFQWWSDRVGATGTALYGRRLWEAMSSHWPTADQEPGATPAHLEFARRWRDMPKVVFSSTISKVDWNSRLVTGNAVAEMTRLKTEDGGPLDVGGATLAAAAMRAGLIDEYAIVTHPVLVGAGTPFFTALDNWVSLTLVETRTFPGDVLLTRYETRR